MGQVYAFEIEQVFLPYNPEELLKWRQGDPIVVPPEVLYWKGPGRENGYGYAEHAVKLHLEEKGFEVIENQFNLFPVKKSKFKRNNAIIAEALGMEKHNRFQKALGIITNNNMRIELPDICVVRPDFYFIEVKRDKDRLRPPQIVFAAVASAVLSLKFRIYKVLPIGTFADTSNILVKQELPDDIFLL